MSGQRIAGVVLAAALILGGGFLALAGMGYVGSSGDTSRSWSELGSILAGLGVALLFVVLRRER
ncbi:MAG: hypothetical protein FWE71_13820 [Nocardioidaceae bacterium]|nr:hypothetical protein [Nocardioidaceae bacterium]MCL2614086.1 hypothetical protein [Nocardioidaceae bacterium]